MAIKHALFQDSGVTPFGSVTANFSTLLALDNDCDVLHLFNTTNEPAVISLPNELPYPASNIFLDKGCAVSFDFRSNSKRIAKGTLRVKAYASLPTSGYVSVTVTR